MRWFLAVVAGVLVTVATAPVLCTSSSAMRITDTCISAFGHDISGLVPGGYAAARVAAVLLGVLVAVALGTLPRRRAAMH